MTGRRFIPRLLSCSSFDAETPRGGGEAFLERIHPQDISPPQMFYWDTKNDLSPRLPFSNPIHHVVNNSIR